MKINNMLDKYFKEIMVSLVTVAIIGLFSFTIKQNTDTILLFKSSEDANSKIKEHKDKLEDLQRQIILLKQEKIGEGEFGRNLKPIETDIQYIKRDIEEIKKTLTFLRSQ